VADLFIRDILEQARSGQIRIPAFQRGFVWSSDDVAYLMDSIYKGYPFGNVLFWRTKSQLKFERDLGPFTLPEQKPDFPIDYVLDGQQRITSILGVFSTDLARKADSEWVDVYFDLRADLELQESQFLALSSENVDKDRHFPISSLFDSVRYRSATKKFDDDTVKKIDALQSKFKETRIPSQSVETDDRAKIAIIFERVNRRGVELDLFQLLTAWTWSEDFELTAKLQELSDDLSSHGFAEVGEDSNLLLRCCAAVLKKDASAKSLIELRGSEIRDNFEKVVKGLKGAIDFLKTQVGVQTLSNLPYSTALIPLTAFFAEFDKEVSLTADQVEQTKKWFWRSSFSRRFSSATIRNLERDIVEFDKLRAGAPSKIDDFPVSIPDDYFSTRKFTLGTVDTNTFLLVLASMAPRNLVSGGTVQIGPVLRSGNRSEFHHLFPRAFLRTKGVEGTEPNKLANFTFLPSADNKKLGGVAPSAYKAKMAKDLDGVLKSNRIPPSLFDDDFQKFIDERSALLVAHSRSLCGE
jgi:hypothetical protein